MLCPRCGKRGLKDGDEFWCIAHGMYGTPYRATDPVLSHFPPRNRRTWTDEEDHKILSMAGRREWWQIGKLIGRSAIQVEQRYMEIRRVKR